MKELNKRKIFLILRLLGFSILLFILTKSCFFPLLKHFQNTDSDEAEETKSGIAKDQYLKLFTLETQKKLKLWDNKISKNKHSFSSFKYDKKYELLIHKINLVNSEKLDSLIILEKKSIVQSPDIVYAGYELGSFQFLYSSDHDSVVKHIYITYDEKLLDKIIIGDSIINYNLSITNLSVRYELNDELDFLFINNKANIYEKKPSKINMNLVLYKKGSSLFFIFIYCFEKGILIDSNTLPNLLGVKDSIQNLTLTP